MVNNSEVAPLETARFRDCIPPPHVRGDDLYGVTLEKIDPIEPPLNLWDDWKMSAFPKPAFDVLHPPLAVVPPENSAYPQAPEYKLNTIYDKRWRRGWYYWNNYHPSDSEQVYERTMRITMPPRVGPREFINGQCLFDSIPGMIQMETGIPYVDFVGGDSKKAVTVACVQTMASLAQYPEAPQIQRLVDKLLPIVWGSREHDGASGQRAIFEIDGLKHNDRSAKPSDPESNDGSYNLASTILEGNGYGVAQPAVQSVAEEATHVIENINAILSQLYQLIISTCVSKEELDVTDFHAIDNNAYGFGGLGPNNTGNQMNVSSIRFGGKLSASIGKQQGWWHTDKKDDHSRWTLFTLLFRIPEG